MALATQPPATVSVTVSSGDTDAVSVPSQALVFTTGNWSTARSVTVGGVDDVDASERATVAVTLTASGGGYSGVTPRCRCRWTTMTLPVWCWIRVLVDGG